MAVPGGRGAPLPGAPVELVVFDCDGVLVDSERLAVRVEAQLLGELGGTSARPRSSIASSDAPTST